MLKKDFLDETWKKNPAYIRRFQDNLPQYQSLCEEAEYILKRLISHTDIEISQISSRAKSLASFCEKIARKNYLNPFEEITDFAGIRVIFLYTEDRKLIEKIIESEFKIIEKTDKNELAGHDQFGYGALHYLCKLKEKHGGARYDDLKNLVFEVQVRTILQDAWAIVAHHLSYKSETDVPKQLRRKLHALSGLFETADSQFELIRGQRKKYTSEFITKINDKSSTLKDEINLDNLIAYMAVTFPDRNRTDLSDAANLLEEIKNLGYVKLSDLDKDVQKWSQHMYTYEKLHPPVNSQFGQFTIFKESGLIRTVLSFAHKEYRGEHANEYQEIIQSLKKPNPK